jgi:hypothetical protein
MPRAEAGPLRARNRASIRVLVFIARGSGAQAPHAELMGKSSGSDGEIFRILRVGGISAVSIRPRVAGTAKAN